jgi:hypothetical protein
MSKSFNSSKGVKFGNFFPKWGNYEEIMLNGGIIVKIVKLGDKNRIHSEKIINRTFSLN